LPLEQLPEGAVIGTGSLRRKSQLLHLRPDLQISDIRGNVDTRLKKLRDGKYDAIVLAEAGLRRLGIDGQITQRLTAEQMLPAVGQGALGIETRCDDQKSLDALRPLDDPETHAAVIAERTLLAALRGGCLAPVGAWARLTAENILVLSATVLSPDGKQRLSSEAFHSEPIRLGNVVAQQLIAQGAESLIDRSRH
jgi:hydroxymethylbilane synthase